MKSSYGAGMIVRMFAIKGAQDLRIIRLGQDDQELWRLGIVTFLRQNIVDDGVTVYCGAVKVVEVFKCFQSRTFAD